MTVQRDEEKSDADASSEPDTDIEKISKEREEYLEGWKRAKADLINYKKDELRRLEEVARYASEVMVRDLISVLDSFELAIAALEKDGNVQKGVYLIKSKLEDTLRQHGVEKIKVEVGEKFDPSRHDALSIAEGTPDADGTIAEEIETGYSLNGKVIRAPRVKVFQQKNKDI